MGTKERNIAALQDAAVQVVEARDAQHYSCWSLASHERGCEAFGGTELSNKYHYMFSPDYWHISFGGCGWWNGRKSERNQLQRSIALLLAAEMVATGDL